MKDESQPAGNRGKVGSVRTLPTRRRDCIGDCEGKDVTNGTQGCDVFLDYRANLQVLRALATRPSLTLRS
jgi:hypothetical protein